MSQLITITAFFLTSHLLVSPVFFTNMKSVKFRQYPYSLFTFLQTFGTFFCDQYFFCWFIFTTFCLFVLICFRIFFLSPYLLYYGYLYPICLFISPYLRISLLHCKSPYLLIYRLYLSLFADLSVISLLICWFICSIYSYLLCWFICYTSPYLLIYLLYLSLSAYLSVIALLICWFICYIFPYLLIYLIYISSSADLSVISLLICWFICYISPYLLIHLFHIYLSCLFLSICFVDVYFTVF